MHLSEIEHYLKFVLRSSKAITDDEAVLLAHALSELVEPPSAQQKTVITILERLRKAAETREVAETLFRSLNDTREMADYEFVGRFTKRRYIFEYSYYYWRDREILFEHGEHYSSVFAIKLPFKKRSELPSQSDGRFYFDRLTYRRDTDEFALASILPTSIAG